MLPRTQAESTRLCRASRRQVVDLAVRATDQLLATRPAMDPSLGKEMGSGERPRRGDQPLHPQHPRTGGAKHEIHEELFPENPYLGRATSSVAPDHAPHRRQLFTSSFARFVESRSLMNSVEETTLFPEPSPCSSSLPPKRRGDCRLPHNQEGSAGGIKTTLSR